MDPMMLLRVFTASIFAVLAVGPMPRLHSQSPQTPPLVGTYDRPFGWTRQSRSVAVAANAMAATSHPRATLAALDVLKEGGSAADAAIAANAVLCVAEPMSCGLGGDLFAIYWDASSKTLHGLNASGRSPASISAAVFAEKGLDEIPLEGPLPWSVPGCVSGWTQLSQRFGRKPIRDVLSPAIKIAEDGFVVTPIIAGYWKAAEADLAKYSDSARTFLVNGNRAPEAGELFRNPSMARSLRRIAEGGSDAFYRGPIAETIVAFSEANGGYLAMDDFASHAAEWVQPVAVDYRGYQVWELPPNGQGIAALQMLAMLRGYDVARFAGPGDPEYLHLLIEAKKLAFADRARFYADMQFADVPVEQLISDAYAERQRRRFDPMRAATDVPAGDPKLVHGDTIYLTVVDADRNCCSLIQSTYYGFGSKVVPGDVGFTMQNRGALFALDEQHPNRLQPRKRPFHTIIPAMVTRDGRPELVFGVMGGDMQPQGHVQVLVNWIDFGMNIQAAGDAARVRHSGSATPTGTPGDGSGGTVMLESGVSEHAAEVLRHKGHQVTRAKSGMGGYQAIRIDWQRGTLQGATETRKDGVALGY
jgi:gamma-glutamyltranspeptidase/glutathione hydrolase